MIAKKHRISELIALYKGLVLMYDDGANTKAAQISDYLTEQNLKKSLTGLNIHKILDAGGGTGRWAITLAKLGYEVTMMDVSPEMVQFSREKFKKENLDIQVFEGNIEHTRFKDQEFDMVFSEGGVISLTPNPRQMLSEFRRITKPGGYIWLDYLNLLGWSLLQPDVELKLQLATKEEEEIYLGKNEFPFRMFQPRKMRYMLYDTGFMELNEFGNGILTHPMMSDDKIPDEQFEELKDQELQLSRNYNLIASAFHVEVLAQKVIY